MKPARAKQRFYLLCFLPDLKGFGSPPPIGKQDLLAVVTESEGPAEVVQALLLSDDLLQRESVLAGETEPEHADPAVLSFAQPESETTLPDFLTSEPEYGNGHLSGSIAADPIWRKYFLHTSEIAGLTHSHFLQAWVGFEVGLRNALVKGRAAALELDPEPYMVLQDLGDPEIVFTDILAEWSAASNPAEALEALDRARWKWLSENEPWYSFSDDEVAAYTAKLMILQRWQRIAGGERQRQMPGGLS